MIQYKSHRQGGKRRSCGLHTQTKEYRYCWNKVNHWCDVHGMRFKIVYCYVDFTFHSQWYSLEIKQWATHAWTVRISILERLNVLFTRFNLADATNGAGIAAVNGLDDREVGVRHPVGSRIFSPSQRPDRHWRPPSLLSNGNRVLFPRG
jgi:hypothetical protein